jgi:hypothetical protein
MADYMSYNLTNVKIYDDALDFVFNNPSGSPVGTWMERRGRAALAFSKRKVGVRSGALKTALTMQHDRGALRQQRVRLGTLNQKGRGYSTLHHEGTKPHIIISKRGRHMTFSVGGRRVTTRMVRHPGTTPNHYLTDTFGMFVG